MVWSPAEFALLLACRAHELAADPRRAATMAAVRDREFAEFLALTSV